MSSSDKRQIKNNNDYRKYLQNNATNLIKINSDTGDVDFDHSNSIKTESGPTSDSITKTVQLSNLTSNPTNKPNTLQFFKIRTQSFDESKYDTNISN